ncbi:MAG TPA: hypothetical protein VGG39_02045 [Polyangiaceae bacterium]|jgi:hypothetical protein
MTTDRMSTTYELLATLRVRAAIRQELEASGFEDEVLDAAVCDAITRAFVALEEAGAPVEDEDVMCALVRETARLLAEERAAGPWHDTDADVALAAVESSRSPMRAARPVVD